MYDPYAKTPAYHGEGGVPPSDERRTGPVLQHWVTTLGRRHQGVLISCTRGCDGYPKNDPSKFVTRCLRATFVVPFVLRDESPATFVTPIDYGQLGGNVHDLMAHVQEMMDGLDGYPLHFVQHLMHAAQIVGYKHPDLYTREFWRKVCEKIVFSMHLVHESEADMDNRLLADEDTFGERQRRTRTF